MSPPPPGRVQRTAELVRRTNRRAGLVRAVRTARERLPGDANFGDHLSRAGARPEAVIARFLTEPEAWLPGIARGPGNARDPARARDEDEAPRTASRELALTGLQVWQALSQRMGRGAGTAEVVILFSDLVAFSSWVLEAGDEDGLTLLRAVAGVVEPTIARHRGRVVKRLGDGHMAVFPGPDAAVAAALEIQDGITGLEAVAGHRPRLRVGLHCGVPRQIGGDYLGTDVNIAARVCEGARPGEVLASSRVIDGLDPGGREALQLKRRRWFRAKGTPSDLAVFSVASG